MYKYLLALPVLALMAGCCQNCKKTDSSAGNNKDSIKNVLIAADKKFCDSSLRIGFNRARMQLVSENAIESGEWSMPLEGKKAIADFNATHPDSNFKLEWKPLRVEVASSGDLGYTFGGWTLKTKTKAGHDTAMYGNYITIWQRQVDGSWKYVFDGGNDTPKPVTE
jgi:ketosteroid isomerase-like protein